MWDFPFPETPLDPDDLSMLTKQTARVIDEENLSSPFGATGENGISSPENAFLPAFD